MDTVKITVKSSEKASRWELLVRIIWSTLCGIVLIVIGIFAAIAEIIQWLYVLIMGKRHMKLNKFVTNWLIAFAALGFYKNLCTDERPPLMPEL
ncbi:MAG: DUF4389 domain-containing protein [Candidatus Micrarchaeota archaeon]|nr:DUF4389 domain-containing protein [Candidatus Micrarchaeota archaeon]